jgi:hypothetical protein
MEEREEKEEKRAVSYNRLRHKNQKILRERDN